VGESGRVLIAEEGSVVGLDADAEVSHPDFERGRADDVGDCCGDTWLHLGWVEDGWVFLVVERDEEDVRDAG
ncbi:hypothetical protein GJ744_007607, partial [Endocarpon pusillum]